MKTNAGARWKLISLVSVVCMAPTLLMSTACIGQDCDEDPEPPAANCSAQVNGTITRALEVFDAGRVLEMDMPNPALSSGDNITLIRGIQGSDMVTTYIRMDAAMDPEPEGAERCMQVTYAGATMNYTSDLVFERQGDYWLLNRQLLDPVTEGSETFTQTITVRDETFNGTSTLSMMLN